MACRSSGGIATRRGCSEIVTLSLGAPSALIVVELVVRWVVGTLLVFSTTAYLGRLHKYFELTSHFRVQYILASAGCLLVCLTLANWWWAGGALLSVAINLSAIAPWRRTKKPAADPGIRGQRLKLALVNVYRRNRAHGAFLRCIERHRPDVVVVQEVTDSWALALQALSEEYPFFEVLPREDGSGIAFHSRFPFERLPLALPEGDARPGILARVYTGSMSVSILSIHPRAPILRGHFELRNNMLAAAATCLQSLPGPKICIGDLNTSSWSHFFQDLAEKTNLRNVREGFGLLPSWPTFMGFSWLMIPIDHCLVSGDIRVVAAQTGERIGSDHLPLIVELEIKKRRCPSTVLDRVGGLLTAASKCGPGQPPEPHCCREYSACRLSPGAKGIATGARENAQSDDVRQRFTPRVFRFSASILPWKGGFLRRPQRPGTSSRVVNRTSPGGSPSWNHQQR
jgi:endonuclease/exonuclease/phosphatase (EEP) superfamily protein YafD